MKCYLTIFVLGLTILGQFQTASAGTCLKCENCSEEITDFSISEPCVACAVYKNGLNQIDRGCFNSPENIVLVCLVDNCNYKRIPLCEQCTNLETCVTVACGREDDKCYAGKFDDRRGCTSDGVYNAEEWDDFVTCTTDRCNRVPHCVVCDSDNPNEANCLNEPKAFIAACLNHGLVQEANCYRQVDGEHFQLGCTSAADFPSGCGDSTVSCRTCEADGCNAKALMECYTCIDCPTVEPQRLTQLCKDIGDYCYTAKHQNGLVERGCLRDIDNKTTNYIACDGPLCNSDSWPESNSCYQCENCDSTDGLAPSACSTPFEGCYTAQDLTDLSIYRGCVTDADYRTKCDQFNCITCEEENCNSHQVRSQPLWCSSCSGTACNEYTSPRPCREGMLVDHCVQSEMFDIPTYRGCLSDKMPSHVECDCYNAKTFCHFCETDFCNSPELSCYECSSASEDGFDCITRPDVLGRTSECHGFAYCYTRVDENTGHLSRSCANQDIVGCIEGPLCKRCRNHNCNNEAVPMGLPQLFNQPVV